VAWVCVYYKRYLLVSLELYPLLQMLMLTNYVKLFKLLKNKHQPMLFCAVHSGVICITYKVLNAGQLVHLHIYCTIIYACCTRRSASHFVLDHPHFSPSLVKDLLDLWLWQHRTNYLLALDFMIILRTIGKLTFLHNYFIHTVNSWHLGFCPDYFCWVSYRCLCYYCYGLSSFMLCIGLTV